MIIRENLRYMAGLPGFLRSTLSLPDARRIIEGQLASREDSFLRLLQRGVYENIDSPYRRMLEHAGVALGDAKGLVRSEGVEGALSRLYDAGVFLTYEEARGLRPIERGSLKLEAKPGAFDNPLLAASYQTSTGGSRSSGRRVRIDLDFLKYESAIVAFRLAACGVKDAPVAVWRPIPPDTSGIKLVLCYTKTGNRPERWFSQGKLRLSGRENIPSVLLLGGTLAASRLSRSIPVPQYVPRDEAIVVVRWLAEKKQQGKIAFLDTNASGSVRACVAAKEHGLDISGSVMKMSGEATTQAKSDVITEAGCRTLPTYAMAELGYLGNACANPSELGEVHLQTDKIAVLQREKQVGTGATVPGLAFTSLLTSSPTIMLNMESGDYARLFRRDCGCLLGEIGLDTHVTDIRSYDKLTSEGITFVGDALYHLLEVTLPASFGGHPADYQIVEEEVEGLTRVSIFVAPRVGDVDEAAVVNTVLKELESAYAAGGRPTAEFWRQTNTLRVVRREPYASSGGRKVLPLHVLGSRSQSAPK